MSTTNKPSRVLIVEDDDDLLCMMCTLLVSWGYVVDRARSGRVALQKIRENCPDVVLSDLIMPEMSGIDLLRAIRQERSDCVIFFILTTGYGTIHNGIEAIVAGADEVLLKPIDPDTLHHLLEVHGFVGGSKVKSPCGDTEKRI